MRWLSGKLIVSRAADTVLDRQFEAYSKWEMIRDGCCGVRRCGGVRNVVNWSSY